MPFTHWFVQQCSFAKQGPMGLQPQLLRTHLPPQQSPSWMQIWPSTLQPQELVAHTPEQH